MSIQQAMHGAIKVAWRAKALAAKAGDVRPWVQSPVQQKQMGTELKDRTFDAEGHSTPFDPFCLHL